MKRIDSFGQFLKEISAEFCIEALCGPGTQEILEAALEETDRREKRKCPLSGILVMWLVCSMGLHRSMSISFAFQSLMEGLRGRYGLVKKTVTDGALAHARKRLGLRPLWVAFHRLVESFKTPFVYRGLRVLALDGTTMDMPDTPANVAIFGRPKQAYNKPAPFPRTILVSLVDVFTRRILDYFTVIGPGSESYAIPMLTKNLKFGDLLLGDRGVYSFRLMLRLMNQGASFLFRIPRNRKIENVRRLGCGDGIGWITFRLPVSEVPCLPQLEIVSVGPRLAKVRLRIRFVEYRIGQGEWIRLVTSLADPDTYPVRELVGLYHQRWEIELAYDEIKNHVAHRRSGTLQTVLRSKSPELVLQEIAGLLITYNLVRTLIVEAAQPDGIDPLEISFKKALNILELAIPRLMAAKTPRHLLHLYQDLLVDIANCRNPRPRRKRKYPRVVKIKAVAFPAKRIDHTQVHFDPVASLEFKEAA